MLRFLDHAQSAETMRRFTGSLGRLVNMQVSQESEQWSTSDAQDAPIRGVKAHEAHRQKATLIFAPDDAFSFSRQGLLSPQESVVVQVEARFYRLRV